MPKWQRAVNSLLTFARSLYDQFQLVDGRGDFEPSLHEPDHKLTRAQFLNLLVYLGLLEPELRGQGNEPGLEALSRLGDEVGRMALEEATSANRECQPMRRKTVNHAVHAARTRFYGPISERQRLSDETVALSAFMRPGRAAVIW